MSGLRWRWRFSFSIKFSYKIMILWYRDQHPWNMSNKELLFCYLIFRTPAKWNCNKIWIICSDTLALLLCLDCQIVNSNLSFYVINSMKITISNKNTDKFILKMHFHIAHSKHIRTEIMWTINRYETSVILTHIFRRSLIIAEYKFWNVCIP